VKSAAKRAAIAAAADDIVLRRRRGATWRSLSLACGVSEPYLRASLARAGRLGEARLDDDVPRGAMAQRVAAALPAIATELAAGGTIAAVARQFRCSKTFMARLLRRAGVTRHPALPRSGRPSRLIGREADILAWRRAGATWPEIAERCGVTITPLRSFVARRLPELVAPRTQQMPLPFPRPEATP
jgi:AraC-like DNA-binding protein